MPFPIVTHFKVTTSPPSPASACFPPPDAEFEPFPQPANVPSTSMVAIPAANNLPNFISIPPELLFIAKFFLVSCIQYIAHARFLSASSFWPSLFFHGTDRQAGNEIFLEKRISTCNGHNYNDCDCHTHAFRRHG